MGIAEIAEYAGMSRQGISNMRSRDDSFPAPAAELKSGPVFLESEIRSYFEPGFAPIPPTAVTSYSSERYTPTEFDPLDKVNLIGSVVSTLFAGPALPLAQFEPFNGSGVYCLYYSGDDELYAPIAAGDSSRPIYVGTALAHARAGSGMVSASSSQALTRRLSVHAKSIETVQLHDAVDNRHRLFLHDFSFRCLIVDEMWARPAEEWILKRSAPIWNSVVPGLGSHDPGPRGRSARRAPWDELHPGRARSVAQESGHTIDILEARVKEHFAREFESGIEP
ncbi:Eco29kI family restriction endonuclease [Nocardia sp. NPDC056000]|uniref:Eco29kI family restriction endonuclease n=1 Tax=Nocardia sp. NPDC056000 TaxID=3345674 RepID=UPI0035D947B1